MALVDVEDILNDALSLVGGESADMEDEKLTYGPITVSVAPKEGKANTLLADHIFSPSLLLAERIERGLLAVSGKNIIELGAGTALPSLIAAIQSSPPRSVLVTDYPDESILGSLRQNITRNSQHISPGCQLDFAGYEWGQDTGPLLEAPTRPHGGYDVVILSDLLHFDQSHEVLIQSLTNLLAKSRDARGWVGAGIYTRTEHCESFLRRGEAAGLRWLEQGDGEDGRETDTTWRGTLAVQGLEPEQLGVRKGMCRWWVAGWDESSVP